MLRRRRTYMIALLLLVTGAVAFVPILPEHILFRQRAMFSIFDMDKARELIALDIRTYDGLSMRSWYRAPEGNKPVIVYYPGRDGNLVLKTSHLFELADQGYGLLLSGYRGYGGNPGFPGEFAMQLDATALVSQAADSGLMPNGYVLYGYSMGTGLAAGAAVNLEPRGLILEAPISNFLQAVRQQTGSYVPGWAVRTRFDNIARVSELTLPILLLAGEVDQITPVWFAQSLAAASQPFSQLTVVPGASHMSIIRLGGKRIVEEFLLALEGVGPDDDVEISDTGAKALEIYSRADERLENALQ